MHAHLPAARRTMLLSIVIGAAVGLVFSPVCRIRHVTVVGPTEAIAAEVAAGLRLPPQANTVFLPLTYVRSRAAECYRVKRLTVIRRSPQQIIIRVDERQPVMAIASSDGSYTMIDDEGIPLVRTDTPGTLPVAKGVVSQRPQLGKAIPPDLLASLLTCIEAARLDGMEHKLCIDLSDPYMITVQTADGVTGKLGDGRHLRRKTVLFGRLRKALQDQSGQIEYIDVSVESKPTFRRRARN
jgi:cell division protein FtsQ